MTAAISANIADVRNQIASAVEWLVVDAKAPRQSVGCIEIMRKRHFKSDRQAPIIPAA